MHRVKNMNEVMTGIFLILVASLAFYLSLSLSSGTQIGLGPGFVPRLFAFIQLVIGVVLVASGLLSTGEPAHAWRLRPLLLILASITFFAVSIQRMGLVIAVIGLVLISCAANRETSMREAMILALACAAGAAGLFVKLLGLSIALWPSALLGS
jgi:putative tricarboxylic transport membrane protein